MNKEEGKQEIHKTPLHISYQYRLDFWNIQVPQCGWYARKMDPTHWEEIAFYL